MAILREDLSARAPEIIAQWVTADWFPSPAELVDRYQLQVRHITVDGEPYLDRYFLLPENGAHAPPGGERRMIHQFHSDDTDHRLHNHPWHWAWSVILSGGYTEIRATGFSEGKIWTRAQPFQQGDINRLNGMDFHRVVDVQPNTWTLFAHGPHVKPWGFLNSGPDVSNYNKDDRPASQTHAIV